MRGGLQTIASCLGVCLVAASARAQNPVDLSVQNCAFDHSELDRLIRLELSSVLTDTRIGERYGVGIVCHPRTIEIHLTDPLTTKTLERTLLAPSRADAEPERLVALSVAQLYRASWLELAAEPARDASTLSPLPPARKPSRPRVELESAARAARASLPQRSAALIPFVSAGARRRWGNDAIFLPNLELGVSFSPHAERSFWVSVVAGFEQATIQRATGNLHAEVEHVGIAAAQKLTQYGAWLTFGEIELGATRASISGRDVDEGYRANTISGFGAHASLAVALTLSIDSLQCDLLLRGGALYGTPPARVAGGRGLALDGAYAEPALRVGYIF